MSLASLSIDKVHCCYIDEENLQVIDVNIYSLYLWKQERVVFYNSNSNSGEHFL